MYSNTVFWTVVPALTGIVAVIVYSQIAARKELNMRKQGYKPAKYENKMPHEYSRKEKKYTLLIGITIFCIGLLAFYFLTKNEKIIASTLITLDIILWRLLIKIGNKIS